MKRYLLPSLLWVTLLTQGCSEDCHTVAPEATTWCVLVDMSGVREDTATRGHYTEHFRAIWQKVQPGDAVVAALITEQSVTEPVFLVKEAFDYFKPECADTELYREGKQKKFMTAFQARKDSVAGNVADFLLGSDRVTQRTDILSACHVAASVFRQYPATYQRLVFLSDMEVFDGTYDFTRENLDQRRINQIVERERTATRSLPNLANVQVHVAGAHSKSTDRYFNIRNFWKAYFTACGAALNDENYGAALLGL